MYFDGACGFCRRSVRVIGALDWLGRLEARDMTRMPGEELPVSLEQAMAGMPMRTRDGRALCGFEAVRTALLRTPVGFLPAAAMHLPGLSHAAAAVYDAIARRRTRDGCATGLG